MYAEKMPPNTHIPFNVSPHRHIARPWMVHISPVGRFHTWSRAKSTCFSTDCCLSDALDASSSICHYRWNELGKATQKQIFCLQAVIASVVSVLRRRNTKSKQTHVFCKRCLAPNAPTLKLVTMARSNEAILLQLTNLLMEVFFLCWVKRRR